MTIRRVAAFDFDGTLSRKDSLLPFLVFVNGYGKTAWHILRLVPSLVGYLVGKESRQEVKEALLQMALVAYSFDQLKKLGEEFVEAKLGQLIKQEGLARMKWHKAQGDLCILISANLSLFLEPWAKRAGFDRIIASDLEVDGKGGISGRLLGRNCFGEEKVRRLKEVLGEVKSYPLFAYGDSSGDFALLAYADFPYYKSFEKPFSP